MHSIWLFIGFLSIFLVNAHAIKCYDCDSLHEPRCNEYFDPEGVEQTDCDDAEMPDYLRKYDRRIPATGCITKIFDGVEGHRFYIRRGCYFGKLDNTEEACEAPDPYVFFADLIDCKVCDDDLCNTNTSTKLSININILFISLLLILSWHLIQI